MREITVQELCIVTGGCGAGITAGAAGLAGHMGAEPAPYLKGVAVNHE